MHNTNDSQNHNFQATLLTLCRTYLLDCKFLDLFPWLKQSIHQFRGKCSEINRNKLYNTLKTSPIPFDTGFNLLSDGFIWRMNMLPTYTSLFSNFLWSISEKLDFYRLDHYKSKLYYFYGDSYDTQKKEWKASKTEVLELPFE